MEKVEHNLDLNPKNNGTVLQLRQEQKLGRRNMYTIYGK